MGLIALDCYWEGSDALGYSIPGGAGQLFELLLQIGSNRTCGVDMVDTNDEVTLEPGESSPSTETVWTGDIVENGYTEKRRAVMNLAFDLEAPDPEEGGEGANDTGN